MYINFHVTNRVSFGSQKTLFIVCIVLLSAVISSEAKCGYPPVNLTAQNNSLPQTIYSPNWPLNYNDDDQCSWRITAPVATGRIELRVVAGDYSCCCTEDRLRIYDGFDESELVITQLCNTSDAVSIISSGQHLYGTWQTNGDGTAMGYALQYSYHDTSDSCPSGWVEWSDFCYKLYDDDLTWQDALNRCGFDGGFLVSISSYEEDVFIHDTFGNSSTASAWIGMDGSGLWVDATPVSYLNFGSRDEQCGAVNLSAGHVTMKWLSQDCYTPAQGFICKKNKDGGGDRYWSFVDTDPKEEQGGGGSYYGYFGFIGLMFIFCHGHNKHKNRSGRRCNPPPAAAAAVPATNTTTNAAYVNEPANSAIGVDMSSASGSDAPPPFQFASQYKINTGDNGLPPPPSYEESAKL